MEKKSIISNLETLQKKILIHLVSNKHNLEVFKHNDEKINEQTINFMLLNNGTNNLVFQTHKLIISNLIYESFFKKEGIHKERLSRFFFCFQKTVIDKIPIDLKIGDISKNLSKRDVCILLEQFHIHYLNSRFIFKNEEVINEKSNINFKDRGAVYTPNEITKEITIKTLKNKLKQRNNAGDIRILDFGCGTGRFFFQAFDYLTKVLKLDKLSVIRNNLFAVDIDAIATDILKIKLLSHLDKVNQANLEIIAKNISIDNMLIKGNYEGPQNSKTYFTDIIQKGGFDVIISNPPYFLLKVNKKISNDPNMNEYYNVLKKRIDKEGGYFRKSGKYKLAIEGMLNYYKLSIEVMLNICADGGEIGIICPATLFADLSSKKLRKDIIGNNKLREINYFPESAKIFDNITQSTVIFYLQKGSKTNEISIKINSEKFPITKEIIEKAFGQNFEIPYINKIGWNILKKISDFKKIKEIKNIRNKRGELDLTLFKKLITKENTDWRLVRGNMITKEGIIDKNNEYVIINSFLEKKSKGYMENDYKRERLICQQISNMSIMKRLQFVICKPNDIIANSCNYLTINDYNLDKIKNILNSYLLNWRFKITSSNNHINNYELDELPIIDINSMPKLIGNELEKNIKICRLYGLNEQETIYILSPFFDKQEIEKVFMEK